MEHIDGLDMLLEEIKYVLAKYILDMDLFSKFHLNFHWPFLYLKHCGNLGMLGSILSRSFLKHISDKYSNHNGKGYWLMILAIKV